MNVKSNFQLLTPAMRLQAKRYRSLKIIVKNVLMSVFVRIFVHINVQKGGNSMLTTTISDFRRDIKRYLDKVTDNFETLIINRGKDTGVVIMSLEEYNSLTATSHELSSRANEMRLDSAIEKLKKGSSFQKSLIEE